MADDPKEKLTLENLDEATETICAKAGDWEPWGDEFEGSHLQKAFQPIAQKLVVHAHLDEFVNVDIAISFRKLEVFSGWLVDNGLDGTDVSGSRSYEWREILTRLAEELESEGIVYVRRDHEDKLRVDPEIITHVTNLRQDLMRVVAAIDKALA